MAVACRSDDHARPVPPAVPAAHDPELRPAVSGRPEALRTCLADGDGYVRVMIMMDQSKRLSEPLRWGRREKTAVAAVLACVALIAIGLGAYALTSGAPARKDCISLTFASTLGGATVH